MRSDVGDVFGIRGSRTYIHEFGGSAAGPHAIKGPRNSYALRKCATKPQSGALLIGKSKQPLASCIREWKFASRLQESIGPKAYMTKVLFTEHILSIHDICKYPKEYVERVCDSVFLEWDAPRL